MLRYFLFIFLFTSNNNFDDGNFYYSNTGTILFRSEAQQELIKASSSDLIGLLDVKKKTFVFKVIIRTFNGFNSALQQEHFNEKYLESEKFPEAYFNGKIIEDADLTVDGTYDLRAKGKLQIHGVEMERIIRSKAVVKNKTITIESHFSILLSDHSIKIPKVVHEKIASEINVEIKIELKIKDKIEN